MNHPDLETLEAGLDEIRGAPADAGVVKLLVRRPAVGEREVVTEAVLDPEHGLVGDCWRTRGSTSTADGDAHPDRQLTLTNARAVALVAGTPERWQLAGDQLYVDLDLSDQNLPPGTRLEIGSGTVEITAEPHLGCGKFSRRFGVDATKFVNSSAGRELNLRGVNARVIAGGEIRTGDAIRKADA